jgi:transposase InsO family protein
LAFTEALIDAGITRSIGSVGDALDNALMESTTGLYKTEVISHNPRSWAGAGNVEQATAEWVHWHNTTRVHGSIGLIPPVGYEALYPVNTFPDRRGGLATASTGSSAIHYVRLTR